MSDHDGVFESIAVLNPVPNEDEMPEAALSAGDLLSRIDGREIVTSTKTPTKTEPSRRRTGIWVAAAAFAAVLLIGGIALIVTAAGDDDPVVTTTNAEPITTTTVAQTTTTAATTPAEPTTTTTTTVPDNSAIGTEYMTALFSMDPAAFDAIDWDSVTARNQSIDYQEWLQALGYQVLQGPTCTSSIARVSCSLVGIDDVGRALDVEWSDTFIVFLRPDGSTVRRVDVETEHPPASAAFLDWVTENRPEFTADGGPCARTFFSGPCGAAFVEAVEQFVLTDEYAAIVAESG